MQFLFFAKKKMIVKIDFPITEIKMYLDLVGIERIPATTNQNFQI